MTQSVAITQLKAFDDMSFNEKKARELTSKIGSGIKLPNSIKVEFERQMINVFNSTKIIAGQLVNVGRIIFIKLWEFIEANPNMALGTIIGAVLGSFLSLVPIIGSILSLVATFLGAAIGAYLDYAQKGGFETQNSSILEKAIAGATHATKEFFKLIKEIIAALREK